MKEMAIGETELGSEHPFIAGRHLRQVPREPIITLPRGRDYQKSRTVRIVPLEDFQPNQDPFIAIDLRTNHPIKLQQTERELAYRELRLEPPPDLVKGLKTHRRIKVRKTKKVEPKDQSLITTY